MFEPVSGAVLTGNPDRARLADGLRAVLASSRAHCLIALPTGPFYGYNRPGAKISQGTISDY